LLLFFAVLGIEFRALHMLGKALCHDLMTSFLSASCFWVIFHPCVSVETLIII
jgi:hypothetical protein